MILLAMGNFPISLLLSIGVLFPETNATSEQSGNVTDVTRGLSLRGHPQRAGADLKASGYIAGRGYACESGGKKAGQAYTAHPATRVAYVVGDHHDSEPTGS